MHTGASDKKKDQMKIIVPVCVAVVTSIASGVVLARDVVVGGGVSVGYEFDDRQYKDDDEVSADREQSATEQQNAVDVELDDRNNRDEQYSRLRLSPLVTVTSSTERDEVELRYSPSLWYDFEHSDNNVDQDLFASLSRFITRDWQAKLTDKYRLSDLIENRYGDSVSTSQTSEDGTATDTATETTKNGTTELSDTNNRRRYWTNDLELSSEYTYREDSMFLVGYKYGLLTNTDSENGGTYEDYDRHEILSELGHRFDPVWKISVFGSYVRGLFEQVDFNNLLEDKAGDDEIINVDNDLKEYRGTTILQADFYQHHSHTLEYSFYAVDFDAAENEDATIQDVTLGWRWNYSKNVSFGLGAGPSYTKTEDEDGELGYNGRMSFSYAFERGYLDLSAKRGYEVLSFTGTDENGLREFWQSMLRINYKLLDNLSADLYAGYREEDEEVVAQIVSAASEETAPTGSETTTADSVIATESETINRKRYSTGLSLGYSFQQWYKLTLAYDYSKQDSEAIGDSFEEHRVALTLSYETELLKW